ncbi:MAG: hypothetical protein FJ116_01465 [Deltaproteobacteria bacterium]|nr:hypothetical protein [Deltaproteobacteria bacterium]
MFNKTIAIFSIGLILLAACGREYNRSMTEEQALDALTNVTELNAYHAVRKRPTKPSAPPISVAELKALLIQMVKDGKIKVPVSPVRGATANDITNALNAINAIFAAIPQTNGKLSSFTLALSLIGVFAGNLQQGKIDLNTVLAILNQALPLIAVAAPQFVPVVQALIVIIPLVVAIINTLKPPTAMLKTIGFSQA